MHRIVTTLQDFLDVIKEWQGPYACDTETALDKHLLGVSLAPYGYTGSVDSIYIPIVHFLEGEFKSQSEEQLQSKMHYWLLDQELIGHNFTYDKYFLDNYFSFRSNWAADTRIMWHLASAPSGPRPYGLKDAQKEELGWEISNAKELEENVKANGGSLRKGEHYKADLPILGKYASLDARATIELFKKHEGFFNQHDYWWMLHKMMNYNELLELNTRLGVAVDIKGLEHAHKRLVSKKEAAHKKFLKLVKEEVNELEEDWKDRRCASYKREANRVHYLKTESMWTKFNPNSDSHKRELFYEKMGLPICSKTEAGKPQTGADSLAQSVREASKRGKLKRETYKEAIGSYLTYEKANTLSTNFTKPYLDSSADGRLRPGFNICGTVSYRLSGFKPYLLNAPFDERAILKNLKCDEGYTGVHADLSAVEPCITAHYSEDPTLLKVFRDGLGDIYLDLALELFPNDKELHEGYNPLLPITKAVKERFSKQRKVAKIIQLAVQYTGTKTTVARNLNKEGFDITVASADTLVKAYWKKFKKVAEWEYQLRETYRHQGMLRNVAGRIIRVPNPEYKDLSNRFIQSSGHDVLVLWVTEIYGLAKARGIILKPILLDCHDSTSNQVDASRLGEVKEIYKEALTNVNSMLQLGVTIKAEIKTFHTLAGLKGDE